MVQTAALRAFQQAIPLFLAGQDSPRAWLERTLALIEDQERSLKAFSATSVARARYAADESSERWRVGKPCSEIDGMPVGIKDVIETVDMPTGMGSPLFDGWYSRRDAAAVLALREAGAVIVGKTKTTEFAGAYATDTCNPHDHMRTAGGSSAGSAAAVGAGILPVALGTQVMGSIIRPASFCGAYGYKPSVGGINRGGSHDHQSHSCIGLLAASLEDIWHTTRAVVHRVGGDPGHTGVQLPEGPLIAQPARRVIVLRTPGWQIASEGARAAFEHYLDYMRSAGVALLSAETEPEVRALESGLERSFDLCASIIAYESRWSLQSASALGTTGLSPTAQRQLEKGAAITPAEYAALLIERQSLRQLYDRVVALADVCVTLAAPGAAPLGTLYSGNPVFNAHASVLGVPALTLPLLSDEGLPLGLQLMGARHQDAALLSVGAGFSRPL